MNRKQIFAYFLLTIAVGSFSAEVGDQCVLKITGTSGTCAIASDCPKAEEQAKKGISPTLCGFYQSEIPIVCCETNSFLVPNDFSFETPDSFTERDKVPINNNNNNNVLRKSEQKCLEYEKDITKQVQAIPLVTNTEPVNISVQNCEYNSVALIVGGKPAVPGEFPFMALLGFIVEGQLTWKCGATLISNRYVLTAAHCLISRDSDGPEIVRLGELDLSTLNDGSKYVDYKIIQVLPHPNYEFPKKYNDIALIQMDSEVKFNKFIRPACLHTKVAVSESQAIATGWGQTDFAASEGSQKLMKVSLNIYHNSVCNRAYAVDEKKTPKGIIHSMLCAGELSGGKDTCLGDSGGPLIVTEKGNMCKFYVIGVTSFGKSCAQVNTPAVYTRVANYVDWIERTIW